MDDNLRTYIGDYLLNYACTSFDISTMEGKAKAVSFLFPFLDAFDSDVRRQEYINEIGRTLGIGAHAVETNYIVSARRQTSDLLFLAAAILSSNPFRILSAGFGVEDLKDPMAKNLFISLQIAKQIGKRDDADGILSYCVDKSAVRFVRQLRESGELKDTLEKIVDDGMKSRYKASLIKKRERLIEELNQMRAGDSTAVEKRILEDIMAMDTKIKIVEEA